MSIYTAALQYALDAINNGNVSSSRSVIVVVPTYLDYLKCCNRINLVPSEHKLNVTTYTGYKLLTSKRRYAYIVCVAHTDTQLELLSHLILPTDASKVVKSQQQKTSQQQLLQKRDNRLTNFDMQFIRGDDVANKLVADTIICSSTTSTAAAVVERGHMLPLQLLLAEVAASGDPNLDHASMAYFSVLGLNRILPLLALPDFISTMCYTDFEQALFYFWRLISASRALDHMHTVEPIDVCMVRQFHQSPHLLHFISFFESNTETPLRNGVNSEINITVSTISELVKSIAKYYYPYCYILNYDAGNNIYIEQTSGSSVSLPTNVVYSTIACLDIDWESRVAYHVLPYYSTITSGDHYDDSDFS